MQEALKKFPVLSKEKYMSNQKTNIIESRLTSKYGITLPLSIRGRLNLAPMDKIKFEIREDGILLTKASPCCRICGKSEKISKIGNYFLCEDCVKKVKEF